MKRTSRDERRARAATIIERLRTRFPAAATALRHENPFELLIATILSAQCTDERVNMVTPALFHAYPTAEALAAADPARVEDLIRSTGFFRMKARNIIACSVAIARDHGGRVPGRMEDLVGLPGVGRKTANVVLGQAFGVASGVVVDTHVHRLARRLGLTAADTPEKIEADLMEILPGASWIDAGSLLILHGRATCGARRPRCGECVLADVCPSAETLPDAG